MGKTETLTPKIETSDIDTQFVSIDYVHERSVVPNLVKIRSRGTSGQRGNFLCDFLFISLFFFSDQRREETHGRILTLNGSKDAKSRKDVPFGVIKWKIEIWPPIYPQNPLKKWPWIGNFQPKWWNVKLQVYQKVLNQSRWKFNAILGT